MVGSDKTSTARSYGLANGQRRVQGVRVDVSILVLMPGKIADILNHQDHRLSKLILNAETELGYRGRGEVLCDGSASLRKERRGRSLTGNIADVRIAEVNLARLGCVCKRSSGRGVVDDVALHSFIEGSEAAAQHRPAVAEQVFRESYAWLH